MKRSTRVAHVIATGVAGFLAIGPTAHATPAGLPGTGGRCGASMLDYTGTFSGQIGNGNNAKLHVIFYGGQVATVIDGVHRPYVPYTVIRSAGSSFSNEVEWSSFGLTLLGNTVQCAGASNYIVSISGYAGSNDGRQWIMYRD